MFLKLEPVIDWASFLTMLKRWVTDFFTDDSIFCVNERNLLISIDLTCLLSLICDFLAKMFPYQLIGDKVYYIEYEERH